MKCCECKGDLKDLSGANKYLYCLNMACGVAYWNVELQKWQDKAQGIKR